MMGGQGMGLYAEWYKKREEGSTRLMYIGSCMQVKKEDGKITIE